MAVITSKNPATGQVIREIQTTSLQELPQIFTQARAAHQIWGALSARKRAEGLIQLRETLINHTDEIVALISEENGKPQFEALANELIPSLDMLTLFAKKAPRLLRDRNIKLTLMKHRKSYLNYWPI